MKSQHEPPPTHIIDYEDPGTPCPSGFFPISPKQLEDLMEIHGRNSYMKGIRDGMIITAKSKRHHS